MVKIVKQPHGWSLRILEKWETANPNWAPKRGISLVNQELRDKGYEPAKKQDIEETYLSMLQLERAELEKMEKDASKPMLVRILAENMLSGRGFEIIETMLDRGIGKATQKQEIEGKIYTTESSALEKLNALTTNVEDDK